MASSARVRKPQVDPLVPTFELDRWLGNMHVNVPEDKIVALLEAQIATRTDPRWTPAIKRQTIRYAIWRHQRNGLEYDMIMRRGIR